MHGTQHAPAQSHPRGHRPGQHHYHFQRRQCPRVIDDQPSFELVTGRISGAWVQLGFFAVFSGDAVSLDNQVDGTLLAFETGVTSIPTTRRLGSNRTGNWAQAGPPRARHQPAGAHAAAERPADSGRALRGPERHDRKAPLHRRWVADRDGGNAQRRLSWCGQRTRPPRGCVSCGLAARQPRAGGPAARRNAGPSEP